MHLNRFLWDIYKSSDQGSKAIELFTVGPLEELLLRHQGEFHLSVEESCDWIDDLIHFMKDPILPYVLDTDKAEKFLIDIISSGFTLSDDKGNIVIYNQDNFDFLSFIPILSTWLYSQYPDFYIPYFYKNKFQLLSRIADTFGIELPTVPLKRYKLERTKYYWSLCKAFHEFKNENELTAAELCAFIYDFAPNYISKATTKEIDLPKPTHVWMVGANKAGGDFEFLESKLNNGTSFWQGNIETKRGDIVVMYCLAPRSYIHSIWRATADGIADPFFHYYSNIYISHGKKVAPITLNELKEDTHFSKHPLVRKNFQGVNGWPLSSEDYLRLQEMIIQNGGSADGLPQLYSHSYSLNKELTNEREVELSLIEPLLQQLGYSSDQWVRQLPVRMGRGERNFPDYAFLTNKEKGFEAASILIEAKFWIKNNLELEDTFKQVWSYGQRLSAKTLVIADKEAIWIYNKQDGGFDRTRYIKKFWKELESPDDFALVKKLITKK